MPCYKAFTDRGEPAFLCGDLGPHCGQAECSDVAGYRCDFPAGDGKTCDTLLCRNHAFEVAPDTHYCPGHALMWRTAREGRAAEREPCDITPGRRPESGPER